MIAVDDARRHARQCTVHATELAPVLDAKCVRKGRAGRGGGISTAIPRHCATHPIPRHSARVPFGGEKNAVGVHDATATFAAMRRPIATSTTFNLTLLPGAVVRAYPRTARAQRTTVTLLISAYCLLLVLDILLS